jgi:hypothetical protein
MLLNLKMANIRQIEGMGELGEAIDSVSVQERLRVLQAVAKDLQWQVVASIMRNKVSIRAQSCGIGWRLVVSVSNAVEELDDNNVEVDGNTCFCLMAHTVSTAKRGRI